MNEEGMDMVLEEVWEDEASAETESETAEENESAGHEETGVNKGDEGGAGAAVEPQAEQEVPAVEPELLQVPKGEPGKEHPLLTRIRERAQVREMERFLAAYPEVRAEDIPHQVWQQAAAGVPLSAAYAMHENRQLKMQLAAERQDRLNRQRTPGGLGANSGGELDELDRMWNEED